VATPQGEEGKAMADFLPIVTPTGKGGDGGG